MLAARSITSATGEKLKDASISSQRVHDPSRESWIQAGYVVDGRYTLLEPLGQGGMGVVWKARSTALDVDVAVKLVRGTVATSEAFKRMAREAHAAARLSHSAVARVLDFGSTSDGHPYVVMELLRGESLAEVLDRDRKIEVIHAVSILLPLIEGLREAHDQGIVHRDIKPENLFVTKTSRGRYQPKVLDFGIAKLDQQADSSTKLTQDGAVLGSPGYFSPEQACGQLDIDHRTDIWSISVVLYELITGRNPFHGPNYNALLMSILKDTPLSIMSHGFGDSDLWEILTKGLTRDRDARWNSMGDLGQALAGWLYNQGVRADITARSLKEVWLENTADEDSLAPPFSPARTERTALNTVDERRDADTLAGGTLSSLKGSNALPTRTVAGWGAAAVAACVALAALLGTNASPTLAPSMATNFQGAQLPSPSPLGPPRTVAKTSTALEALDDVPIAVQISEPIEIVSIKAQGSVDPHASPTANPNTAKASPRKQSTKPKAKVSSPKLARGKARRPKTRPPRSAIRKRATPATSRKVDKEFGF